MHCFLVERAWEHLEGGMREIERGGVDRQTDRYTSIVYIPPKTYHESSLKAI